jgi:hypothetical protein
VPMLPGDWLTAHRMMQYVPADAFENVQRTVYTKQARGMKRREVN